MLKRIKVRGKLLLLLATPLVAVMVFAYSGVIDRTDRTAFQESEARIAELADAGADLSLAIQVERIRVLEVQRLNVGNDDVLGPEKAETDARLATWIETVQRTKNDIVDDAVRAEFVDLAERLPATISVDRPSNMVTGSLLASASSSVDDATILLASQAQDLDLFRALSDLNEVINIQTSYSAITSIGSEAIFQKDVSPVAATLVANAERSSQNSIEAFNTTADESYKTTLLRLQNAGVLPSPAAGNVDALGDIQDFIDDPSNGGALAWLTQGEDQLRALNDLIGDMIGDASTAATLEAAAAQEEAQSFLILAGSVVLLALTMAIVIGRSISRPLIRLTRSAEQLSTEELPALVESMRSAGRAEAPVLTPIEAKGRDEVAQLAHAISEIQQVTIDVAEEQGDLLRRGISDIFVNLARRNQSLLDRQIDFIDQLESREENPDALENLFRLDHLATRMRRNAESLLVLAGSEPTRRRGRPVEIVDVLRVAMGEIEDFGRIQLMSVDPSTVAGSVAVDMAHLMSELMENATQFSPPTVDVDVVGYRIADGSYQLTLSDHGIGMSAEQLATANKTLAEPPLVGLDLSRSLGFTVVSRLAHRLGVSVQLTGGAEGGVTAVITIPAEMVGDVNRDGDADEASAALAEAPAEMPIAEPEMPDFAAMSAANGPAPEFDPTEDLGADPVGNPFGDATPQVAAPVPVAEDAPPAPLPTREPAPQPAPSAETDAPPALPSRRPAAPAPEPEPAATTEIPVAETPPAFDGPPSLPTRQPTQPATAPTAAPQPVAEAPSADGDLFAAFGAPSGVPAAPSDPAADLFAGIDGGQGATPPAPSTPSAPAAPAAPAASVAPVNEAPPAPPAPAPPITDATPPQTLPSRDPAAIGAVAPEVTSAGLIRRTPKQVNVPEESKYAPTGGAPAQPVNAIAPAANRSPDEVRQMLSRYRAGLRKGRGPESDSEQPNRRS